MSQTLIITAIVGGIIFIRIISQYNMLIALKNTISQSVADIDVQLKNRFDLVDNLVQTVKGYATHEEETLTAVTTARTSFLNAGPNFQGKDEANGQLTMALKSLFAVSEAYPDLKANAGFLQLQSELSELEDKIAAARRFTNASITEYATTRESFPGNIVAGIFGFRPYTEYFAANDGEKVAPKVSFS